MHGRDRRDVVLTLGGVAALLVGAYLPLFRTNPLYDGDVPDGFVPESSVGVGGGFDALLVGLAFVVVALLLLGRLRRLRAVASVAAGLLAVGWPARYLLVPSSGALTVPFDASAPFVPGLGWYGLVVAGILLFVAGGRRLL